MGKGRRMRLVFYTLSLAAILFYPVSTVLKIEFPSEAPVEMKFPVRAFDPYDPLRGRYVRLDPLPNEVKVPAGANFRYREKAFLVLERDRDGFARAVRLTKDRSEIGDGEIFVKVGRVVRKDDKTNKKNPDRSSCSLFLSGFLLSLICFSYESSTRRASLSLTQTGWPPPL